MHYSSILPDVIKVADEASEKVLHIYQSDFKVSYKADDSPITAADTAAHEIIAQGLRRISTDIPILSEEGRDIPWEERKQWRRFWLVDPIDGTKDFTQRTGEFTVNIAMIEDGINPFESEKEMDRISDIEDDVDLLVSTDKADAPSTP